MNPISGKGQFIWLIDPVYADASGKSSQMKLLAATTYALGELLGHDPHFAHGFSRNPFYTGKSPSAYRWYRQHNRVMRLGDLIRKVRDLAGTDQYEAAPRQQFKSGRELINAVKTRREEAQAFKALAQDVDAEVSAGLDQYDPELIDGVRVLWITEGTAARDETAFRHALKTGHRLRTAGQRLTDAAIIDAYEHAYNVAQTHGGAGRPAELPPPDARPPDYGTTSPRLRDTIQEHGRHWFERSWKGNQQRAESLSHHGAQRRTESLATLENRPTRGICTNRA